MITDKDATLHCKSGLTNLVVELGVSDLETENATERPSRETGDSGNRAHPRNLLRLATALFTFLE